MVGTIVLCLSTVSILILLSLIGVFTFDQSSVFLFLKILDILRCEIWLEDLMKNYSRPYKLRKR